MHKALDLIPVRREGEGGCVRGATVDTENKSQEDNVLSTFMFVSIAHRFPFKRSLLNRNWGSTDFLLQLNTDDRLWQEAL